MSYGQSIINDYPEIGLDTKLINIILKATYIIKGPLYSYLRPYIGYQLVNPDSPGAGKESTIRPVGAEQLELELQRVDNLKISSPIFGASVLKRLVPGWFVKANIGSDMISFGFALEF